MSDIFIDYSREDREAAKRLATALQERGWSVSWDHTITAGQSWRDAIGDAMADAGCIVVLWSKAAAQSPWVAQQAIQAWSEDRLVLARLDDAELPVGLAMWPP